MKYCIPLRGEAIFLVKEMAPINRPELWKKIQEGEDTSVRAFKDILEGNEFIGDLITLGMEEMPMSLILRNTKILHVADKGEGIHSYWVSMKLKGIELGFPTYNRDIWKSWEEILNGIYNSASGFGVKLKDSTYQSIIEICPSVTPVMFRTIQEFSRIFPESYLADLLCSAKLRQFGKIEAENFQEEEDNI